MSEPREFWVEACELQEDDEIVTEIWADRDGHWIVPSEPLSGVTVTEVSRRISAAGVMWIHIDGYRDRLFFSPNDLVLVEEPPW